MSRKRARRDVSPKSGDEFANSGEENADVEDFDFTSQEDFASISRVESGTTGRQPYRTNRRTCPHCQELVSIITFKTHRRLFYDEVVNHRENLCTVLIILFISEYGYLD